MSLKDCTLCDAPGARKVRVMIFPWDQRCIFVCAACKEGLPDFILELRKAAGLTVARP